MTEKVKVCAYCRVSTDEDNQLNSLENQRSYFQREADKNERYEFYKIYADEGLTATSWKKREEFKRMLIDAGLDIDILKGELRVSISKREPKFNRILIKDVSRFSRNAHQGLELVTKLREKDIHIDFVSLGLSTEQMTNDMIIGFFLLAAENESKDKSVKTAWGQKRSAEKGVILTADKFFGYRYIKDTNELVIVPEEAEIIRTMYDLYSKGEGFRRILQYLEVNKLYTRAGKPFVQQSVKRILQNPAYKGWLVRNKLDASLSYKLSRTFAKLKDETEWIIHKGRIPAIVSEELFDQVQIIRKSKVNYKNGKGVHRPKSEYADLIKCGKCGSSYTKNREPKNGREYYNCSIKKRKGVSVCNGPNVDISVINKAMDDLLRTDFTTSFNEHKSLIIGVIEGVVKKKLLGKIDKQSVEAVKEKQTEINGLREQKNRLADLYLIGEFDKEYLEKKTSEINVELDEMLGQLNELSKTNEDIFEDIGEIDQIIMDIRNLECPAVSSIEDVKKFISIIVERKDNKAVLEIEHKYVDRIQKFAEKFPELKGLRLASSYS